MRCNLDHSKTQMAENRIRRRVVLTARIADGSDDCVVIPGEVAFDEALSQASIRAANQDCCGSHDEMCVDFVL